MRIAQQKPRRYLRAMCSRRVTVFGGTGFLGRHIVSHLLDADLAVRIASRHPDRANSLFSGDVSGVESAHADVNDDGSVARAVAGAWAVVIAVSLYPERGKCTFRSVHVDAAKRIAMLAAVRAPTRVTTLLRPCGDP